MQHMQAVEVVTGLIPRMRGSSPEEVLSKFATEHRLAPEQLKKMAHVYNTCATLSAQEVDRNSIPRLIQVPAMVEDYVRKSASSGLTLGDSFMMIPVKAAAAPAPEVPEDKGLPWVWKEAPAPKEKAASAAQEIPVELRRERLERQITELSKKVAAFAAQASEELSSYGATARALVDKMKAASYRQEKNISRDLERDAHGLLGEPCLAASLFDDFGKVAARMGFECKRVEKSDWETIPLFRDSTGLMGMVRKAASHRQSAHTAIGGYLTHLDELIEKLSDPAVENSKRACSDVEWMLREVRNGTIFAKAAQAMPREDPPSQTEQAWNRIVQTDGRPVPANRRQNTGADMIGGMIQLPFAAASDAVQATGRSFSLADLASNVGLDEKLKNNLSGMSDAYQKELNQSRLDLEQIENDTRALATLQRVMTTDEILSEKDPEMVLEAFNTVRRASPEVSRDPSLLRLVLRQALETQGVDIDTATGAREFEFSKNRPAWAGTPRPQA